MNPPSIKIAISAGEPSGDEHAAGVLRALRLLNGNVQAFGMGGPQLREAGLRTIINFDRSHSGSIMGFAPVLKALGSLRRDLASFRESLQRERPQLLLIVDYPDFNLRLARAAHEMHIPVVNFIPAKVWAWRAGRLNSMRRILDHVALIYPHEREFYAARNFSAASYVGHPFAAALTESVRTSLRTQYRKRFGWTDRTPAVALLPGSRSGEIVRTLGPLVAAYREVKSHHPELRGVLPVAPTLPREAIDTMITATDGIEVLTGESLGALAAADAGLLKSGTSNLQAAFLGLPFAMFYKASLGAAFIVRTLVKVKEFSPVNVVRPHSVRELLQEEASPHLMAEELTRLLFDDSYRAQISTNLQEVARILDSADPNPLFERAQSAYERTALLALHYCSDYTTRS